jgi:hypothetical protein
MGGWFRETIRDPAPWVTLAISAIVAFCGNEEVLRSVRIDVGVAQVGIGTALLGIVLAGLAILIVFLDEEYIKLLQQVPPGIDADLWPFKYTALIAIMCAAFGMLLIVIGKPHPLIFRIILWLSLWSFSYLLWLFYDVIKFVIEHAKARIMQIQKRKGK